MKRLPEYKIKINGSYLSGYDEHTATGKTGHMGWHPQANELTALVLTPYEAEAMVIEGNISLKSQFDRIYDRMRFGGLVVKSLSIVSTESPSEAAAVKGSRTSPIIHSMQTEAKI